MHDRYGTSRKLKGRIHMDFNLPAKFTVEQLAPGFWRFNEGMGDNPYVDAYLLVGNKRAAFIDALQSEQPKSLAEQIRDITDLPVDVLITQSRFVYSYYC